MFFSRLLATLLLVSTPVEAQPNEIENLLLGTGYEEVEPVYQLPETIFDDIYADLEEVPTPPKAEPEYDTAVASYYGRGFNGRPTASGYVFQASDSDIVAHRELPFGTKVEFVNPRTGATLVVTVRDRGPCHGNREFDLSEAAAQRLDFRNAGTATLEYRIVEMGGRPYPALNCSRIRNLRYG